MKPEDFDNLPQDANTGQPVIKLMADPNMTGPDAFLSLVPKGANGRKIKVRKAVEGPGATGEIDDGILLDLGQSTSEAEQTGKVGILKAIAGALGLGRFLETNPVSGDLVIKADGPTTFQAAIAVPKLWDELWMAEDALRIVIRNVLEDDEVTDKLSAVQAATAGFAQHVNAVVAQLAMAKVSKAEAAAITVALATGDASASKIRVERVSKAGLPTIEIAENAGAAYKDALAALRAAGTPQPAAKGVTLPITPPEDESMIKLEEVTKAAEAAAALAIKVAKSAGITDPSELAKIGAAESGKVFKAAVMGPPQPGIPTTTLQTQITESQGTNGQPGNPMDVLMGAINAAGGPQRFGSMVTKMDEIHAALFGKGEGDDKQAGLQEVVAKNVEATAALAERVKKMAGTPATPPASGGGQPAPTGQPELATKAEDEAFAGSALGGFGGWQPPKS
ncbi:MAG: hypothetical protein ACPGQD_06545 [Planctomycetota bacterium]